jgi:hypothetical protein
MNNDKMRSAARETRAHYPLSPFSRAMVLCPEDRHGRPDVKPEALIPGGFLLGAR